nr:hypothetical protein Iba_chr04bCG19790 [Ipomoea batatas]GMC87283.1 hypothetical protein Iba_chr04dCG18690 [Ipomoea batatas]
MSNLPSFGKSWPSVIASLLFNVSVYQQFPSLIVSMLPHLLFLRIFGSIFDQHQQQQSRAVGRGPTGCTTTTGAGSACRDEGTSLRATSKPNGRNCNVLRHNVRCPSTHAISTTVAGLNAAACARPSTPRREGGLHRALRAPVHLTRAAYGRPPLRPVSSAGSTSQSPDKQGRPYRGAQGSREGRMTRVSDKPRCRRRSQTESRERRALSRRTTTAAHGLGGAATTLWPLVHYRPRHPTFQGRSTYASSWRGSVVDRERSSSDVAVNRRWRSREMQKTTAEARSGVGYGSD